MLFLLYVFIRARLEGITIIDAVSFYEYIKTIIDPVTIIVAICIVVFAVFGLFTDPEQVDVEKDAIRYLVKFVISYIIVFEITLFIPDFFYNGWELDVMSDVLFYTVLWTHFFVYSCIILISMIVRGCKKGIKITKCITAFVAIELVAGVLAVLIFISMCLVFGIIFIPTILTCFEGGSSYGNVSQEENERRRLEDREIELTLISEMINKDDD